MDLFRRGDSQGNAPGSKWAAVNAIVEYGDWHRAIRQGGERFAPAIDEGTHKTRALELVVAAGARSPGRRALSLPAYGRRRWRHLRT